MRDGLPLRPIRDLLVRMNENIERITETGCWIWMGTTSDNGYGKTSVRRKNLSTHRAMYQALVGPIPQGMFACHRCDVKSCCNPAHIFIGTPKENTQDCIAKGRDKSSRITHCKHGHEYTLENTRYQARLDGTRTLVCAACKKIACDAYRASGRELASKRRRRLLKPPEKRRALRKLSASQP